MSTVNYYNSNAHKFFEETSSLDMSPIYLKFQDHLNSSKPKIMDAGCGSGRDAKYFLSQGYEVYAFDSAAELARLAGNFLGQKVHNHGFLDLVVENDFDGIWACASLLHLNSVELSKSLDRLLKSLKPGGVFYCSFKYGEFEGERGGRYFIDMNENRFINLTEELCCEIVEMWITTDVRPNLQEQKWLNIILKKS